MRAKLILTAAALAAVAVPAQAAEFYVVQDAATKKCTIVEQKPADDATVVLGEKGKAYATRTEAETATKTVQLCTAGVAGTGTTTTTGSGTTTTTSTTTTKP